MCLKSQVSARCYTGALPMRCIAPAALVFLCVAGCSREIVWPPPPQRTAVSHPVFALLDMTGGRPEELWASIVSGVGPGSPSLNWRWTESHAAFRFTLDSSRAWKLRVRLTAAQAVLDKAGPQRITFDVNGKNAGNAVLDLPRRYDLTFPVDAQTLRLTSPVEVSFDVDRCLGGGRNGPYCVLLHSIGFVQEPE